MCVDGRGNCHQAKLQGGRPEGTSGHQRACDGTAVMKPDDESLCHLPLLAAALSPARSRGQRRPWKVPVQMPCAAENRVRREEKGQLLGFTVGSAPTAFSGLTLTSGNLHEYSPYFQALSLLTT